MALSIYLGQIFGLYLFITSIALLVNQKFYKKAIAGALENPAINLVFSIMSLIIGLILVIAHNIWIGSWEVIITILCWLVLLKGIIMFLFPTTFPSIIKRCKTKYKMDILDCIKWTTWICLFLGAYLLYLIYFRLPINPSITF